MSAGPEMAGRGQVFRDEDILLEKGGKSEGMTTRKNS